MLIVARMKKQIFHLHRSLRVHTTESGVLNGGVPATSDRAQLQSKASLSSSPSLPISHTHTHVHPPASLTVPGCMHTSNLLQISICSSPKHRLVFQWLLHATYTSPTTVTRKSSKHFCSTFTFICKSLQASWPRSMA